MYTALLCSALLGTCGPEQNGVFLEHNGVFLEHNRVVPEHNGVFPEHNGVSQEAMALLSRSARSPNSIDPAENDHLADPYLSEG